MALAGENTRAMDMLEIVSLRFSFSALKSADILLPQQVVSVPGQTVAAIQLDAYKKLILVQLLATGNVSSSSSQFKRS